MEKRALSFDVCIVCALPEEARAFLQVMQQYEEGILIEEYSSPRYRYSSRIATIKNIKGEPLTLHISWPPRNGPQDMALYLPRVLEDCQPRICIMTGICAGDAQQVQLGDPVVAERTFTYDNGKFTTDEHGRRAHLHDTTTYQPDAKILQFLGLFDEWEPVVARLERPSPLLQQRNIVCHMKAMASGNAVRTDNPFENVRIPVRGTVAIDMEGAAFGQVMSHHPQIPWLVVKGVCDYADRMKDDTFHRYAAHVSALYALSFIQAYVTNKRLPRHDGLSPSSRTGPRMEQTHASPSSPNPSLEDAHPADGTRMVQLRAESSYATGYQGVVLPSPSPDPNLASCTVQLFVARTGAYGTGFFVTSEYILTCAHVVQTAYQKHLLVSVHWKHDQYAEAHIVKYSDATACNLALLKLTRSSLSAHLPLNQSIKPGDVLATYGYAQRSPTGEFIDALTCTSPPDQQAHFFQIVGREIPQGFSGAPLYNQRTWGVCGMITLAVPRQRGSECWAIPIVRAQELFPELLAPA